MTTWTPILITTDGDVLLSKENGEYFSVPKHSSVSGTQRHSYPRAEARALYAALGRWLGADEMICEAEDCRARPVSDLAAVPAPQDWHAAFLDAVMGDAVALGGISEPPEEKSLLGNPDAKHGVSPASVLEHCLEEETAQRGYRAVTALGHALIAQITAQLIGWRIPASGRYADYAHVLALKSGGRYPMGEVTT